MTFNKLIVSIDFISFHFRRQDYTRRREEKSGNGITSGIGTVFLAGLWNVPIHTSHARRTALCNKACTIASLSVSVSVRVCVCLCVLYVCACVCVENTHTHTPTWGARAGNVSHIWSWQARNWVTSMAILHLSTRVLQSQRKHPTPVQQRLSKSNGEKVRCALLWITHVNVLLQCFGSKI